MCRSSFMRMQFLVEEQFYGRAVLCGGEFYLGAVLWRSSSKQSSLM